MEHQPSDRLWPSWFSVSSSFQGLGQPDSPHSFLESWGLEQIGIVKNVYGLDYLWKSCQDAEILTVWPVPKRGAVF